MNHQDISPWNIQDHHYHKIIDGEYSLSIPTMRGAMDDPEHNTQKYVKQTTQHNSFRVKEMRKSVFLPRSHSQKESLPLRCLKIDEIVPINRQQNGAMKQRLSLSSLRHPLRKVKIGSKGPKLIQNHPTLILKQRVESILKSYELPTSVASYPKFLMETVSKSKLQKIAAKTSTIEFLYGSPLKSKLTQLQKSKQQGGGHVLDRLLGRWE